ncbi:MAG TPA: type I-B CRISPR-associated protein Cas5b [Bacteroidota bacterium]|nr:type I-B CRISPR-associated protein Cas5b [Bacteroidota bacterium]
MRANSSVEVLKVRLHQHTAVYRNPITSEVVESYPLPPPSTIIGFVHSLLKKLQPDPNSMNISIQGEYAALLRDYQWYKKYDGNIKGFGQRPYPILVHTLFDVSLLLHFYFPKPYESMGKEVERLLKVPPYFPYMGRAEDLVKIEDVHWEKSRIESIENGFLSKSALIPQETANALALQGVPYKLSGWYRYVPVTAKKQTKVLRDFDWFNLHYVEKDAYFEADEPFPVWIDEQGDYVWWSMQNPIPETIQKH